MLAMARGDLGTEPLVLPHIPKAQEDGVTAGWLGSLASAALVKFCYFLQKSRIANNAVEAYKESSLVSDLQNTSRAFP
jgi:hypothetical protein